MTEFCNPSEEMDPIAQKLRVGELSITQFERARRGHAVAIPIAEEMDAAAQSIRLQSESGYTVEQAEAHLGRS